jgi:hypothetical protein
MKHKRTILVVILAFVVGGATLAEPSSGGGGPFKPCPSCKVAGGNMGNGGK